MAKTLEKQLVHPLRKHYELMNIVRQEQFRTDVCKECNVSRATFYRWLDGNEPDPLQKKLIASLIGVTVEQLWKGGSK